MEFYSTLKNNEMMTFARKWIQLEVIKQNMAASKADAICVLSYICSIVYMCVCLCEAIDLEKGIMREGEAILRQWGEVGD